MRQRAIVIGSGLGGLLAAEALGRFGAQVEVFERLSRAGGKFAAHDHEGFQVPTGAFHTIPYGRHGFLAQALSAAGVRLRLAEQPAGFVVRTGRRRLRPPPAFGLMGQRVPLWTRDVREIWRSRRAVAALLIPGRPVPDVSLVAFLSRYGVGSESRRLLAKIAAYGNGVGLDGASAVEFAASARAGLAWPSAVIRGGCQDVVDRLLERLRARRVAVHLGARAEHIAVADGRVRGVVVHGALRPADAVVSNVGPAGTAGLLGSACPAWLSTRVAASRPAHVIAYAVRSRRSLVPHPCLEVPLSAPRIAGYVQVTNAAPELAPPGWHLLLALSLLDRGDAPAAIRTDKREILRLFPSLGPDDVFHVSVYQRRVPATETPAVMGAYGSWRYPLRVRGVDGLMMIGHDSVGIGYAAEIIGYAALRFRRVLGRDVTHRRRD